ncbi:MAG: bifunctional nicotinamidase/pyrazinamidase [Balneolaceae bacterium]
MKALLIVDVQYDFLPGGALGVPKGDRIISRINEIIPDFKCVIQTQDWHPADHSSFAANNQRKKPFETVEMEYGEQILWPVHCVQGMHGADFHHDLDQSATQLVIRKGFRPQMDSYSAFFENDHKTTTGLHGYLQERQVDEVFISGLATDFCVKWSALDAIKKGYKIYIVEDAVSGIDIDNSVQKSIDEMKDSGVLFLHSSEVHRYFE